MNASSFLSSEPLRRAAGRSCRVAALVLAAVALGGGGCATKYDFTIDAVRYDDTGPSRTAYVLVDHTPPGSVVEPGFACVASDVRTALSSKGLFEAPAGIAPQFEVEIDFGLEGPVQKTLTHTEPVYALVASAPRAMGSRGADESGAARQPRKIGERTVTTVVHVYRKFLRLTARPVVTDGSRSLLWSVIVTNEDESSDVSRYVRLMAAAATDAIDQDTGPDRKVVLTNRDGRVVFIERGM